MNSSEPDSSQVAPYPVPSFQELEERYNRLKREGRLPSLEEVVAVLQEVASRHPEDARFYQEPPLEGE
jgi:hypothetical protein